MHRDEPFQFESRDSNFFSQLPSVLITVAAISLIVLVNTGTAERVAVQPAASSASGRPAPATLEASPEQGKPAPHAAGAAAAVARRA